MKKYLILVFVFSPILVTICFLVFVTPSKERIDQVKEGPKRYEEAREKLLRIFKGIEQYIAVNNRLPEDFSIKKSKTLSWRVALLPFIGEHILFSEFNLSESWNSSSNNKLIDKMPSIYSLQGRNSKSRQRTTYFSGTFHFLSERQRESILNGKLVAPIVLTTNRPIVWTKPEDCWYEARNSMIGEDSAIALISNGGVGAYSPKDILRFLDGG